MVLSKASNRTTELHSHPCIYETSFLCPSKLHTLSYFNLHPNEDHTEVPSIPAVTPATFLPQFAFQASARKDDRPQNVLQNVTSAELAFLKPGFAMASAQLREGFVPPSPCSSPPSWLWRHLSSSSVNEFHLV